MSPSPVINPEDRKLTFGSLFAGIGGFDIGFERAGLECKWQVEINPFAQKVLAKLWPTIRRHDDVRTFPPEGDWSVDIICGGFPCQDISNAGKRAGIGGERSGLFYEAMRIVCEIRPSLIVLENVTALLDRGMDEVLGALAAGGFDAEWDCFPASAFGAYSERDRIVILAYRQGLYGDSRYLLEAGKSWGASLQSGRLHRLALASQGQSRNERLECEPGLARLVGRVPDRTHRLEAVGNSVYPPVFQWIGERIIEARRSLAL